MVIPNKQLFDVRAGMLARSTVYLFLQKALLNNISFDSSTLKEITNSIN